MSDEQKKYDVFISYSHEDRMVAEGVCGYLESNKIRCFIDYRDIPKGASWSKVIPYAIRGSKLMLAIFSKNFNASEQTDNEISIASNRKIPVLVFRTTDDSFEGTKEYFLTKSNWIEAFPEPEKCFGELYNNICILLGVKDATEKNTPINVTYNREETLNGEEFVRKGLAIIRDENGDRELAVYNFRKAAKEGHPEGEYRLGVAYSDGDGIPHSRELAFSWLEKAASHGHARAMGRLAKIYHYGIGVERNSMRALELYIQAAEAGDGFSMKSLGKVFASGELGVQDNERSSKYYEQAFETLYDMAIGENDADAQCDLGNSYLDGEGVQQNYTLAVKMFQRAMANALPRAYNALGICYESGYGVAKDCNKGFELKLKSAELGVPIAMKNVAMSYLNGDPVEKNEQKYIEWIRKSADCGHPGAQSSIGTDYLYGKFSDKDIFQARKWLEKAAEGGDFLAMCNLASMYESGDIIDEDGKQKALQLYKRAAISGNVYACYCLANCYYHGKGTAENDVEALRWYGKITDVYESMKAKGDNVFLDESGAGSVQFSDFDIYKDLFVYVFENISWIYSNSKSVEHDSSLAAKWGNLAKLLKGETETAENADAIERLENSVRSGSVEALDELLDIFKKNSDASKMKEWSTYAVKNKILVKKADRVKGWDHLEWVLKNAAVDDKQVYVDYLKAHLDAGGSYNCAALYNAVCEEYKKGNLQMTEGYWKIVRDDAAGLLGLNDGHFCSGYLRERREHFDVIFPGYNPKAVLNGDFSDEKNFKLFYAANTEDMDDRAVFDYGLEVFAMLKKDKSYAEVVKSGNRSMALFGNFGGFLTSFISVYDKLCAQYPFVRKEHIDAYAFKDMVPICPSQKTQRYLMQAMKALISARSLYKDKWNEIVANLACWNKLLDVAEEIADEDLQLLLLEYVEMQIEAESIFKYSEKLDVLRCDKDKVGIAKELNDYVKRLEENGIPHGFSTFTDENLPEWILSDNTGSANDDVVQPIEDAESICDEADEYYYGRNGKQQDYKMAVSLFLKSAQMGYAYAQYSLAFCYHKGKGVNVDYVEAAKWYLKAAELGNTSAQCEYALCCKSGRGVPLDLSEAFKWLSKSANSGYTRAQELLGDYYYKGDGVERSMEKAKYWYEKAAEKGSEMAKKALEEMQQNPGPCRIVKSGDKYGFANENGDVVIPCQWTKVEGFVDGVALVWNGGKMGAINEKGEYYFPCKISCANAKYIGHNMIKAKDALYSLYDLNGADVNYDCFEELGDKFVDGYMYAVKYRLFGRNKVGRIDIKGKFYED